MSDPATNDGQDIPQDTPPQRGSRHCIALVSGGLDSLLAVHFMLDQGIRVTTLQLATPFGTERQTHPSLAARPDVGIRVERLGQDLIDVVRRPPNGYGRNMNPCIDCHILMLRRAKALMPETGASFVVTGEVLDQRPMSQRIWNLLKIEREAGLEGLLLRPLSARHLPVTIPEQQGLVDRERLGAIRGRSRREQIALAKRFGITTFSQPAGGCLLTDPIYSDRLRELFRHDPDAPAADIVLLQAGRHFRLSPAVKAVVGRDEAENIALRAEAKPGDLLLEVEDHIGPVTLLRGTPAEADVATAAALTASHSKRPQPDPARVRCATVPPPGRDPEVRFVTVPLLSRDAVDRLRIGTLPSQPPPPRSAD